MNLPNYRINYFFRAFIMLSTALFILSAQIQEPVFASPNSFVSAKGTELHLNGKPYRFTGLNVYQMGTVWGTNSGCGSQIEDIDGFFSSLRPNSVVRLWAFQGSIGTNAVTKNTDFTPLDRVIASATKHGHKLIIALAGQSGTCDDGHWKNSEWYRSGFKKAYNDDGRGMAPLPYFEYVKSVVSRYKHSPAIAMWEPVSEPEASECTDGYTADQCYLHSWCKDQLEGANALRTFFDTVGGEIKRIDPNHLVESGVIGGSQCGVNDEYYAYIHQSPGIDVASYHDYEPGNKPMPGDQWTGLQRRLIQMKNVNKPLIIGEVGIEASDKASDCLSLIMRKNLIKAKMDAQFKAGISGFLPWSWQQEERNECSHDITPSDPLTSLLKNYPLDKETPTSVAQLSPTGEVSETVLGGLDLHHYCTRQSLPLPTLSTGNWTCGKTGRNIDMTEACMLQYKNPKASAKQDTPSDHYSWSCYSKMVMEQLTPTPTLQQIKLGGLNLDVYCKQHEGNRPVLTEGLWSCGKGKNTISMKHACEYQYGDKNILAKQEESGNPYSWSCFR